jgi:hypothetical protein
MIDPVVLQQGHALAAAARYGFCVFPVDHPSSPHCRGVRTPEHDPAACTERGKHPACKWSSWSTTDVDLISSPRYFGGREPANIGIDCGKSRLLVVDEDALEEFVRFCAHLGVEVPTTFTVHTSDGRRHFYFRQRDGQQLGNQEGALRKWKLNVRGVGGYVVGPGSLHASEITYEILVDVEPIEVPGWLERALAGKVAGNGQVDEDGFREIEVPAPKDHSWWRDAEGIPEGSRHHALAAAAGWCRAKAIPVELARPIVLDVLARCAGAKYDGANALAVLADIYDRYPAGEERDDQTDDDQAPQLIPASAITMDRPRWVWDRRVPVGWDDVGRGARGHG